VFKHLGTKVYENGGTAPITLEPGIYVSGQFHDLAVLRLVVKASQYKMNKQPQDIPKPTSM